MTRKLLIIVLCLFTLAACTKKDDGGGGNNNGNNMADNTFKVTKGGGAGIQNVTIGSVTCGEETGSAGTSWSFRAFFSVGTNSTYDRIGIGFKTEPSAADFPVVVEAYYANLATGKAGVNITYDSYNYVVAGGNVTVSIANGKKKVTFNDLLLESGIAIPGTTGTKLPDGSTITGTVVCQ